MKDQNERADVYQRVTDQIIEALESGAGEWRMPWHKGKADTFAPTNAISRKAYRGINVLNLWAIAQKRGYGSGLWATYPQWQQLGAQVRKGEKSALVVFWKFNDKPGDEPQDGAEREPAESSHDHNRRILARAYYVFNAEQVDGFLPPVADPLSEEERIAKAEEFFSQLDAEVHHGGSRAYYSPSGDFIQLPPFESFKDAAGYYATRAHESIHWTGAPHRLNRDLKSGFDEAAYAAEELVAELGAAFLCADFGIANDPRPDHAAYLAHWLGILRADKRALFTAASKAQAAADWLHARASVSSPEMVSA
ncbi:MAG TPA: zincin-like metallopeptidase domain-containing protein [Bryobacteraceae bacterium]|nr:zincin-like metallopeptidase domain-containing protein [Bryobacteraceae bacterium]